MQYEIKWPFEDSLGKCFHRVAATKHFLNSCELCKFVNEASLPLVFVSACIDCPDFLFRIIKNEDPSSIAMFLSSRYLTYQDAF